MSGLTSVAVFCGSRFGTDPAYEQAAVEVGRTLAERGITAGAHRLDDIGLGHAMTLPPRLPGPGAGGLRTL